MSAGADGAAGRGRGASDDPLFAYRPAPADGLLAAASVVERGARALLRRLSPGPTPGSGGSREWPAVRPPGTGGAPAASPPAVRGAPILYLPALPWAYRFQRPQQLALALAARGVPVVWAEGFLRTRLQPRLQVAAPAGGLRVVRMRVPGRPDPFREPLPAAAALDLAAALAGGLREAPRAIVAQLPFWSPLARALASRFGVPLVYDRIDLHAGFPGVPPAIGAVEEELIAAAGLVTATSEALADLPRRLGVRTVILRNACDPAAFAAPPREDDPAAEARRDRAIAAGLVGALDDRIDAGALEAAARAHPSWRFRLAGRVDSAAVAALARLPNVELVGEIPYRSVPGFLAGLDLGLVPYRDTPLTRAIDPVKLYEMLAAGLPVALRRLPGAATAGAAALGPPLVYPYDDPAELPALLDRARAEDSAESRERRRAVARAESWDHRAAALLAALAGEC